jgi:cytochrome c biogenesis protein CcmG/thiol:disulfide interchange protein DsbE
MSAPDAPAGGSSFGRRKYLAIPLIVFAGLALLLYARLYGGDPAALPSALIGRPAPDLALPALDGLTDDGAPVPGFARGDLTGGEVTVVNVFASWCAPCRAEHPLLMALAERGVRIFGLNHKDATENARRFLGGLGNPYERVGVDPNGRASIEWGVYGVPETFVIDGKGRIAYKFVGPLSEAAVESKLLPEIEKARAAK